MSRCSYVLYIISFELTNKECHTQHLVKQCLRRMSGTGWSMQPGKLRQDRCVDCSHFCLMFPAIALCWLQKFMYFSFIYFWVILSILVNFCLVLDDWICFSRSKLFTMKALFAFQPTVQMKQQSEKWKSIWRFQQETWGQMKRWESGFRFSQVNFSSWNYW